jgi:hypothetical protein
MALAARSGNGIRLATTSVDNQVSWAGLGNNGIYWEIGLVTTISVGKWEVVDVVLLSFFLVKGCG